MSKHLLSLRLMIAIAQPDTDKFRRVIRIWAGLCMFTLSYSHSTVHTIMHDSCIL